MSSDDQTEGIVVLLDKSEQFEWQIDDENLQQVALGIHAIACGPMREYRGVEVASGSAARIEFRLTSDDQ